MSDKEKKKYVLVIEYYNKEDKCEYIKEELIYKDDSPSLVIGTIDLEEYFSEVDIAGLTTFEIGKT